jgi:CheY-like chemotaxis protein
MRSVIRRSLSLSSSSGPFRHPNHYLEDRNTPVPSRKNSLASRKNSVVGRKNSLADRKNSVGGRTNVPYQSHMSVVSVDENDLLDCKALCVLLVDDSSLSRKMMRMCLGDKFDEILEADDGVQAVELVEERMASGSAPDVILMDFMMPNMDGPTATNEIRSLGYRGIIIGVTGNTLPHDIHTFLSSGANEVLAKPVEVKTVDKALKGRSLVTYPSIPCLITDVVLTLFAFVQIWDLRP